jgi:phosphoglycerate dehydrogenase-like enzyme
MSWRVLVSAPYMQPSLDRFAPFFAAHDIDVIVPPVRERMEEAELMEWLDDIDGVICGDDRFTRKVLEGANRLKVITKWGTGIDSIDQRAAAECGIRVLNTPNAFTMPVADSVMGYVLAFARRLPCMNQQLKAGQWEKIPGRSLFECTLGVIGVGNIGRAVVRRARSFDMRILGNDVRTIESEFVEEHELEVSSLETLLSESDFISLNCDLNPTSYHILGAHEFTLMKPRAVVINTARGPLIEEPELARALQRGAIAGAALDVFEEEPLPVDSPLFALESVMLAPHNSNSSPTAWERVHQNSLKSLLRGLAEAALEREAEDS